MRLVDAEFPVFILRPAEVEERDGILFADGLCLDDKNAKGDTLHSFVYPRPPSAD